MIVLSEACRAYGPGFCAGNAGAQLVCKRAVICMSAEVEVYLLALKN